MSCALWSIVVFGILVWIKKNDLGNLKTIGKGNYFWIIPDEKIDFVTKKFFEKRILVGVSENRAIELKE